MQIQPTNNQNFNSIYKYTKLTSYGRCIEGSTDKREYFVYVAEDPITKMVKHKLYVVNKLIGNSGKERWVKSVLRFFSDNKVCKEIRSEAK